MARPLAVYTDLDDLDPAAGVALLEEAGFRVEILETRDPDLIAEAAREATALLVGYSPVDADLLTRLPHLEIVSLLSRGFDSVDTVAASERGLWVATVGDLASAEVAVHTWALALAAVRRLDFFTRGERSWLDRPEHPPRRLSEITLGLVGVGRIGSGVARLADGHVGRILGHDRSGRDLPAGVVAATLDEVVTGSDIVSIHLPLDGSTTGLFDARLLARMRPGSWLLNVSRGAIVDTDALIDALDDGPLAGAALDVLDHEPPPPGDRLATHPKVMLTPHVAYLSDATARDYVLAQARNVVEWHRSGRPIHPVAVPEGPK